jgi:hypothetical protein
MREMLSHGKALFPVGFVSASAIPTSRFAVSYIDHLRGQYQAHFERGPVLMEEVSG